MVILPIENKKQPNKFTCWLSAAAQIIEYRTGEKIILKDLLFKLDQDTTPRAGSIDDVKALMSLYKLKSMIIRPSSFEDLTDWVRGRDPVILQVGKSVEESHMVVVRGVITDTQSSETLCVVNDPELKTGFSLAVTEKFIMSNWEVGLVVMQD